jgi:type IV pilus assembly protein PilB
VPETTAKKFNIVPLFEVNKELTIAISNPTDVQIFDIIGSETGCRIIPVIAPFSEITKTIEKYYLRKVESFIDKKASDTGLAEIKSLEIHELQKAGVELPIIKIVDRILMEAVEDGASDIHVEPREDALYIRFRIDGILQEFAKYPGKVHPGVISRIKILSFLDISERRKPQDGRIKVKIDEKEIDVRVSTLPAQYGEKAVMRLLHRDTENLRIEELGLSEKNLNIFHKHLKEPYGIILVTGPTGSGKTTTLYAALNEINSIEKNIITIEDPIEYNIPVINQVQANPKIDVTFANILRSVLRQDPDVIMIGEIRDRETAFLATEAALTGHLVFSTLHTNDAPSSIVRLIEMGVEPFLLSPSLLCIIAQRLLRRICNKCKEEYVPSKRELDTIGLPVYDRDIKLYKGTGCKICKGTGYKGRSGIHEFLEVNEKIRQLIVSKSSVVMIREEAIKNGFKDMRFDGLRKVISGETTVEELLRVTRDAS